MKKKRRIIIWGIVAAIVIFQLIRSIFFGADKELVFRTHVVGSQTIENSVTATGTIEPVEEVQSERRSPARYQPSTSIITPS